MQILALSISQLQNLPVSEGPMSSQSVDKPEQLDLCQTILRRVKRIKNKGKLTELSTVL